MKEKRSIPLNENFYTPNINDLIYTYLLKESTFYEGKRYLSNSNFVLARKAFCELMGITTRKFTYAFDKILAAGLMVFDNTIYNVDQAYSFPPYTSGDRYQLIDTDIIDILVSKQIEHSIKLYTFLLNKILYYGTGNYVFTFGMLAEELGWASTNSRARTIVHQIMEQLKDLGLINYEEFFWEGKVKTSYPIKKQKLTFVKHISDS